MNFKDNFSEIREEKPKRLVAYYASWSAARGVGVNELNPDLYTHLNYAFASLSEDGNLHVSEDELKKDGAFYQFHCLKEQYPHLKILLSVGGWTGSKNFSDAAASESKRSSFVSSALSLLSEYGFDGLDIDWEFPVTGGDNIKHCKEDGENYVRLVKELRTAFDKQKNPADNPFLLTIAGGPSPSFVRNAHLKEMEKYLDFINIMSYDYHGDWENVTGHNAPLYASGEKDKSCVSDTVHAYIESGVNPESLNLGLPFYGRGLEGLAPSPEHGLNLTCPPDAGLKCGTWEAGVFDYRDLVQNYIGKNGYTRYYDSAARVPYLFNGNHFISYDDKESIGEKLAFARRLGLGGAMFWELSGDKEKELQNFIYNTVMNKG